MYLCVCGVCVCVCVFVCMTVCVYIYICMTVCESVFVCVCLCVYVCMTVSVYVYMYDCVCECVCVCVINSGTLKMATDMNTVSSLSFEDFNQGYEYSITLHVCIHTYILYIHIYVLSYRHL